MRDVLIPIVGDERDLAEFVDRVPTLISWIGGILGVALLGEMIITVVAPGPVYRGFVPGAISSAPFIAGLIYAGYWLKESGLSSQYYDQVARWWIGGMIFGTAFIGILTVSMRRITPVLVVGTVRWSAAIGGSIGLIIGILQARTIQQAIETDRVRRRQEAIRRERDRLDEFASIVSHDLRSPLTVAQGHLELLTEDYDESHVEQVSSALDRMESIIDDTLKLARAGQRVGETTSVDLSNLAQECWQAVHTADGTLTVEDSMTIEGDADRLRHLFENFFRNAVEHGGEDVTIRVGSLDDADGFYVEDDGPGIPAEQRDEVFEPGYTSTEAGTGFGLSIVRDIVHAHGWEIEVKASETGGARFEINGVEHTD